MLVLTRRVGEDIVIGGDILVRVMAIQGDRIRLGFRAPESVQIDRREVFERRVAGGTVGRPWSGPATNAVDCTTDQAGIE